jgi:hypothetical protein
VERRPQLKIARQVLRSTGRHRDIIAAEGVALRHVPDVVDVTCPGCGHTYIAAALRYIGAGHARGTIAITV